MTKSGLLLNLKGVGGHFIFGERERERERDRESEGGRKKRYIDRYIDI